MGKLEASCQWGIGPDILLINKNKPYLLYNDPVMKNRYSHGCSFEGSMELTLQEAIILRDRLDMAIHQVQELEQTARDYFEAQGKQEKEN